MAAWMRRAVFCGLIGVTCTAAAQDSARHALNVALAATHPTLGDVTAVSVSGQTVKLSIGADELLLGICSPNIVRVDYRKNGHSDPDTPVIDPMRTWTGDLAAAIDTTADPVLIRTSRLTVQVSKFPCRVTLTNAQAKPLLWEAAAGGVFVDNQSAARGGIRMGHAPGAQFFGLKAYHDPIGLLRNGDKVDNRTYEIHAGTQGEAGAPFLWTTAGYALLIDSDNGYVRLDDTHLDFFYGNPPLKFNGRRYSKDNCLTYYLIVGDPKEIFAALAQVTGQTPMFPKWAVGFTNSEWKIDQSELLKIVGLYRAKDIPLDNYTLDFDWKSWGEDNFGEFRWNSDAFPSAASGLLKAKMDSLGVKMTGIMKPRIVRSVTSGQNLPLTLQASEAETNGYFYEGVANHLDYFSQRQVGELNFSKADCRKWYWKQTKSHGAMEAGIVGFWNDEADEADLGGGNHFIFDNFEHFHMQQALYEGLRASSATPAATVRMWSINRNFYLGAQRFGYGMWSGDIGADFGTLAANPERMISAAILGQAKWGMDTGGFFGHGTPELYARWIQFSSLVPIFRVHGTQGEQRQPWVYGNTAEEVAKAAIRLRYELAPYVYGYDRTAYESGIGLVRPLFVEFPDDRDSVSRSDEWMFGEWMLAAPVLKPELTQSAGQSTARSVYLPPGTWTDYFRGVKLLGGRTISYPINPGSWADIPLFVREGAIIQTQRAVPSIGSAHLSQRIADVFPGPAATSAALYDDDGQTYAYEDGQFLKQTITVARVANSTILSLSKRSGTYASELSHYLLRVHGRAAATATLDSHPLPKADQAALSAVDVGWTTGEDVYGPFTMVKVRAQSGSDHEIVLTGDQAAALSVLAYEAEEGSLSGDTLDGRPMVEANHPGFTGAGFAARFEAPGAALTFYTRTRVAGLFGLTIRAANGGVGERTLSVYVNGLKEGALRVPPQANWDTWANVYFPCHLAAGNNIITVRRELDDSGQINIDHLLLPLVPLVGSYEAESAELGGGVGVNVDHRHYSGTGFVDRFASQGASVTFSVFAPEEGSYGTLFRVANGTSTSQTITLRLNGAKIRSISIPSSGNWDSWLELAETLPLSQGSNAVTLAYEANDSGNVNIDCLRVSKSDSAATTWGGNLIDNGGFESGVAGWLEAHDAGPVSFGVDAGDSVNPPEYPRFGDKRAYFFSPSPYGERLTQHVAVPASSKSCRFEAWVRCANAALSEGRAEISGDAGAAKVIAFPPNDGQWHRISVDHVAVTAGQAIISFIAKSAGGSTVQLDGVSLMTEN